MSDELAKFSQVFCLVVIVATPLLLLYSRRRAKTRAVVPAPVLMAGAEAISPQSGHSCDHGVADGGHAGSDCGGSH